MTLQEVFRNAKVNLMKEFLDWKNFEKDNKDLEGIEDYVKRNTETISEKIRDLNKTAESLGIRMEV